MSSASKRVQSAGGVWGGCVHEAGLARAMPGADARQGGKGVKANARAVGVLQQHANISALTEARQPWIVRVIGATRAGLIQHQASSLAEAGCLEG